MFGIGALKEHLLKQAQADRKIGPSLPTYPEIGSGPGDEAPAITETWRDCPGCRWRRTKTDSSHTRVPGVCKHPLVEPVSYNCPGCKHHKPDAHSDHTYEPGECRLIQKTNRPTATRRRGKHPRAPGLPPDDLPVSTAQAQLPDGTDLGAGDEEGLDPPRG